MSPDAERGAPTGSSFKINAAKTHDQPEVTNAPAAPATQFDACNARARLNALRRPVASKEHLWSTAGELDQLVEDLLAERDRLAAALRRERAAHARALSVARVGLPDSLSPPRTMFRVTHW